MNRSLAAGMMIAIMLTIVSSALGQGMMVPKDTTLPPLAIKSQKVSIAIDNQVATTTVEQVFINSTNRQLEANYVFPLPPEATTRDFAMMVDGKRVSGELVEAARARQIYQQIVSQARDPGLLEHLGDNLFRVNIFPVPANGTQTVELTFSQVVPSSGGVCRYTYPLKTGSKASQVQDFFSVGVKLSSKVPIKTVYSPTHQIGVSRKGDHEATVGLEMTRALLDRDFSLYWTVSDKTFGLSAVAYRPSADEDGYLMVLLAPKSAVSAEEVIAKDVQFVFDTSGSMSGEKLEQAKKALKYCVENLNERDRFNVITFSTDVTPYKPALVEASKANKEAARDYINRLQAEGGTNIHEALARALDGARAGGERVQVIVFLTDGRPTIGKTGVEEILSLFGKVKPAPVPSGPAGTPSERPEYHGFRPAGSGDETPARPEPAAPAGRKDPVRIFTFGVGDDVNTKLLDKIAQATGGTPEYVRAGEDIEVKVSDFFAKASHPVMTDLKLGFGGEVKVAQMLPRELPDLYFGQQVVAFARYSGSGAVSVTLSGTVSTGKQEKHTYEVTLPRQTTDNNFIEPLWAHRKVGYLLDQIRLHGESSELKDEVIRLSKKYKIQTPYTSYLVLEEQHRRQYLGEKVAGGDGGGRRPSRLEDPRAVLPLRPPPTPPAEGNDLPGGPAGVPGDTTVARAPSPEPAKPMTERERKDMDKLSKLFADGKRDDDEARQAQAQGGKNGEDRWASARPKTSAAPATQPDASAYDTYGRWDERALKAESGEAAVDLAKAIASMKQADRVARGGYADAASKTAAGRTFYQLNGFWVDETFAAPIKMTFVKWGSEAYFAIVSAREDLKAVFALGTRVILVTASGKALVISDTEGEETLTAEQVKELFAPAEAAGK